MPDISLIMNFHAEGVQAHWSLLGFQRMRDHALRCNLNVQLIAVLDRSDADTRRMVSGHPVLCAGDKVLEVEHGDLGLSRNAGVASADALHVGFLDGDDYCSANWLVEALRAATAAGHSIVVHPEYTLSHGTCQLIGRSVDQLVEDYPLDSCFKHHPWVSVVFAAKSVFLEIPYRETRVLETGYGYEDWDWNLQVVASGRKHTLAAQTCLFYRRKDQSMLVAMNARKALVRPGPFFDGRPFD
ncbi:hypothetical protein M2318_000365 [Metapseudomonas resinovorans]|uniref:glycosyltransferase n=1 Tax=Metapseudomonas resinovorans TaxID=53412 RepID=UPI003D25921A